jgi:hypothetical protein
MDLCNRRGRERLRIDAREDVEPDVLCDRRLDHREGERRRVVRQVGELFDVDVRHQLRPRREQLAELDVRRAELFESATQLLRALARRRRTRADDPELAQQVEDACVSRGASDLERTAEPAARAVPRGDVEVGQFRVGCSACQGSL